jgi:hypothetical protein
MNATYTDTAVQTQYSYIPYKRYKRKINCLYYKLPKFMKGLTT